MFQLKLRLLHSVYKKLETRASAHLRLRIRGRRPRLNRNFLEAHFQPKLNQALSRAEVQSRLAGVVIAPDASTVAMVQAGYIRMVELLLKLGAGP